MKQTKTVPQTFIEFNYKYDKYLADKFYGLNILNDKVVRYLDKVFEEELTNIPNFKYYQIKTKFGMCSFYCDKVNPIRVREIEQEIDKLINDE